MITPQERYGQSVVGTALLFLGAIGIILGMILGAHDFSIHDVGIVATAVGMSLIRNSLRYAPRGFVPIEHPTAGNNSRRALGIASIALIPFFAASLFILHIDAVDGAHQAWPLYVFAVVAFICFLVWLELAVKIAGSQGINN